MVKGYVSALLEGLGHADKGVREGASEALGVLMKIIGEPQLSKLMPDLDPIKMAKVKEYCEKTVLTGKMPKIQSEAPAEAKPKSKAIRGGGGGGPAKKTSTTARPGAKTSTVRAPQQQQPQQSDDDDFQPPAQPVRKPSSAPARPGRGRGRPGAARPATSTAASRKKSEDVDISPPYRYDFT